MRLLKIAVCFLVSWSAAGARADAPWREADVTVEAAGDEPPAAARMRALREARLRVAAADGGVRVAHRLLVRSAETGGATPFSVAVRQVAQDLESRIVEERI